MNKIDEIFEESRDSFKREICRDMRIKFSDFYRGGNLKGLVDLKFDQFIADYFGQERE